MLHHESTGSFERQTSAEFAAVNGVALDALPPAQVSELRLLCALYSHGQLALYPPREGGTDVDVSYGVGVVFHGDGGLVLKVNVALPATYPESAAAQVRCVELEGASTAAADAFAGRLRETLQKMAIASAASRLPSAAHLFAFAEAELGEFAGQYQEQQQQQQQPGQPEQPVSVPPPAAAGDAMVLQLPFDCWVEIARYLNPIDVSWLSAACTMTRWMLCDNVIWEPLYKHQHPRFSHVQFSQATNYEIAGRWNFEPCDIAANPPKFIFSWCASFRLAAYQRLQRVLDRLLATKLRGPSCATTRLLDRKASIMDTICDSITAQAWCELFHESSKQSVKCVARFFANYHSHNFNIALGFLDSTPWERAPQHTRAQLGFPTSEEELNALRSQVRLKSFDSDIEKEVDVTTMPVARVKHRDFQEAEHSQRKTHNFVWSPEHRRWIMEVTTLAKAAEAAGVTEVGRACGQPKAPQKLRTDEFGVALRPSDPRP